MLSLIIALSDSVNMNLYHWGQDTTSKSKFKLRPILCP